jgi:hypothetical protein
LNLAAKNGATPTYVAAHQGHTEVLTLLVAANATISPIHALGIQGNLLKRGNLAASLLLTRTLITRRHIAIVLSVCLVALSAKMLSSPLQQMVGRYQAEAKAKTRRLRKTAAKKKRKESERAAALQKRQDETLQAQRNEATRKLATSKLQAVARGSNARVEARRRRHQRASLLLQRQTRGHLARVAVRREEDALRELAAAERAETERAMLAEALRASSRLAAASAQPSSSPSKVPTVPSRPASYSSQRHAATRLAAFEEEGGDEEALFQDLADLEVLPGDTTGFAGRRVSVNE